MLQWWSELFPSPLFFSQTLVVASLCGVSHSLSIVLQATVYNTCGSRLSDYLFCEQYAGFSAKLESADLVSLFFVPSAICISPGASTFIGFLFLSLSRLSCNTDLETGSLRGEAVNDYCENRWLLFFGVSFVSQFFFLFFWWFS